MAHAAKFWLIGTRESPKGQVEDLMTKENCLLLSNPMPFLASQQKVLINSCLETKQQRPPRTLPPSQAPVLAHALSACNSTPSCLHDGFLKRRPCSSSSARPSTAERD
jgi:hypothetical protein